MRLRPSRLIVRPDRVAALALIFASGARVAALRIIGLKYREHVRRQVGGEPSPSG